MGALAVGALRSRSVSVADWLKRDLTGPGVTVHYDQRINYPILFPKQSISAKTLIKNHIEIFSTKNRKNQRFQRLYEKARKWPNFRTHPSLAESTKKILTFSKIQTDQRNLNSSKKKKKWFTGICLWYKFVFLSPLIHRMIYLNRKISVIKINLSLSKKLITKRLIFQT